MHLLPPMNLVSLDDYRRKRDEQHATDLNIAAFDLARLTREVREETERVEDDWGDAA